MLAAPDKYRGTLSAAGAAAAIAHAARRAGWQCDTAPVSDGGEGFLEVFGAFGAVRTTEVPGPLGAPVLAPWALRSDPATGRTVAVIESALANGLALIGGREANDPLAASTSGVGHLVQAALAAGADQVLVGMGGSATTDGGLGAVQVLAPDGIPPGVELVVACDVETGFEDAAAVFAPQKGASPAQVEVLRKRLKDLAEMYRERFGVDVTKIPGSGAAGGLAGGLAALGATLVPGFDLVAERLSLRERARAADLVVTGEGYLDEQSFAGKAAGGVISLSRAAGAPVLVIVGDRAAGLVVPDEQVPIVALVERYGRDRAMAETAACIAELVEDRLSSTPQR